MKKIGSSTASDEKKLKHTSFCASCGRPVRWEVNFDDERRNAEFCEECECYASKIIAIDMKIESLEREAANKSTDFAEGLQIEQLIKERDVAIRVLDTIRIGTQNELKRIATGNLKYSIGKPISN
jgi:hypothetical protein